MKSLKPLLIIAALTAALSAPAFSAVKMELMLEKIPPMPGTYKDAMLFTNGIRFILEDIDREYNQLMKTIPGADGEMDAATAMAMAQGGGITAKDAPVMQKLAKLLEETGTDVTGNSVTYSQKASEIRAELEEKWGALDEEFNEKFSQVNDGEGSTDADLKKAKALKADKRKAQIALYDTYSKKMQPVCAGRLKVIQAMVKKGAPVAAQVLSTSKSFALKQQALSVSTSLLNMMKVYLETIYNFYDLELTVVE